MASRLLRSLSAIVPVLVLAASAQGASDFTLPLDSTQSVVEYVSFFDGTLFSEALSGSISVSFDQVPGESSFQIVALSAAGSGVSLDLDTDVTDPGSGLAGSGVLFFTVPLALDVVLPDPDGPGGASFQNTSVGVPSPIGSYQVTPDGQSIDLVFVPLDFQFDPEGEWQVTLVAVPEPSTALLLAFGLVGLSLRHRRRVT